MELNKSSANSELSRLCAIVKARQIEREELAELRETFEEKLSELDARMEEAELGVQG